MVHLLTLAHLRQQCSKSHHLQLPQWYVCLNVGPSGGRLASTMQFIGLNWTFWSYIVSHVLLFYLRRHFFSSFFSEKDTKVSKRCIKDIADISLAKPRDTKQGKICLYVFFYQGSSVGSSKQPFPATEKTKLRGRGRERVQTVGSHCQLKSTWTTSHAYPIRLSNHIIYVGRWTYTSIIKVDIKMFKTMTK